MSPTGRAGKSTEITVCSIGRKYLFVRQFPNLQRCSDQDASNLLLKMLQGKAQKRRLSGEKSPPAC